MTLHAPLIDAPPKALPAGYLETLAMLERLHRLLLDVIKDEFERLGNIAENEVTAGELKSRGYYQGSNVSYNLKKLVELGYMHHQRSDIDRRSVRVRLTEQGHHVSATMADLFARHSDILVRRSVVDGALLDTINGSLKRMERFWTEQIRYIY